MVEQCKMVKYNYLAANLLIFHTVVGMTRALDGVAAEGHSAALTAEAMSGTNPYLNEYFNRFGSYELDLTKPPRRCRSSCHPRGSPHAGM